jgi:hypothetical protein
MDGESWVRVRWVFLQWKKGDEMNNLITVALLEGSSQQEKEDQFVPMQWGR